MFRDVLAGFERVALQKFQQFVHKRLFEAARNVAVRPDSVEEEPSSAGLNLTRPK